jgi:ribosomal protein L3
MPGLLGKKIGMTSILLKRETYSSNCTGGWSLQGNSKKLMKKMDTVNAARLW